MKLVVKTEPGDFALAAGTLEALRVIITGQAKFKPGDIIFMQSPGEYRQKCSATEVLPEFKHPNLAAKVAPIGEMFWVELWQGEVPISQKQKDQIGWVLSKNFEHLLFRSADSGWSDVFPPNLRSEWWTNIETSHDKKRLELAGMYKNHHTD